MRIQSSFIPQLPSGWATQTASRVLAYLAPKAPAPDASPFYTAALPPETVQKIKSLLPEKPMVIPFAKAEEIKKKLNLSQPDLLSGLATIARDFARPPSSGYHVGEAAVATSGNIYLGVNLEFTKEQLNQFVHGEQFLVAQLFNHGEKGLESITIPGAVGDMCGHCRQFLHELGSVVKVWITGRKPSSVGHYLPRAYGRRKGTLLEPKDNHLIPGGHLQHDPVFQAAFDAANRSYSPYSNSPSGIALKTRDGKVYSGSYLEVAGANPSLPPLQCALVSLVADGKSYDSIVEAHLVETETAKASHEGVSRMLLKQIAPLAKFHHTTVKSEPTPQAAG